MASTRLATGAIAAAIVAAFTAVAGSASTRPQGTPPELALPLSVRITSPLGRTGLPGAIRIVARVHAGGGAVQRVRFYVNDAYIGEDDEGPLYAHEWVDENPFDATAIRVEAMDAAGRTAIDKIDLAPFEVIEVSEVSSVLLEATVTDAQGRFVRGLTEHHFRLSENGEPQTLDLARPETLPAVFTLLVDSSQSMHRRMDFVREAAGRLSGYLGPKDRVLVAPFSRTLGALTGPTADLLTVRYAIDKIRAQGGTAIVDSLASAAKIAAGLEGRNAIVLVTDGYDEDSEGELAEAIEAVRRSHATLYVIGVGGAAGISLKGERFLKSLAAAGGGRAFFPSREEELPAVHELVARDVQMRYLVSYTPTNQRADGTWREVALTTTDPEYIVRTRPGYRAPSPPPVRPSLEFTVTDRSRRIFDVSRDDLVVLEDGVAQDVDTFHEAIEPVSIVMLLDASGSMVKAAESVKVAARSFVDAVRTEDSLSVVLFADAPITEHDLTRDRAESRRAIDGYVARGGTALYDALCDALLRLEKGKGRKVVVALTDGRDENNPGTAPGSLRAVQDVEDLMRRSGAAIYTIGLGPRVDATLLERLAVESGGESYFPEDVSTLRHEYDRIVENLRRRYVLSYSSTNPERDGEWRAVEIRSAIPDTVVRSPGGYFAPAR